VENPVRFSKGRMDAGIRRMIGGERTARCLIDRQRNAKKLTYWCIINWGFWVEGGLPLLGISAGLYSGQGKDFKKIFAFPAADGGVFLLLPLKSTCR
jgi:hypothetical protein